VVDPEVVDGVVMVGLDTSSTLGKSATDFHRFMYERKAATKVVAFLSAFEFKRLNSWH